MKESLFEILLNLFEKTLIQLKEKHQIDTKISNAHDSVAANTELHENKSIAQLQFVRSSSPDAVRIFTKEEQTKLTKPSLQLLVRMVSLGVLHGGLFELILNRLLLSESRIVSLQETKWTIRHTLAETLNVEQLAFLELILYHNEDGSLLH
jgi:uncharacterized protein Smg (DUF494 family)